MKYKVLNLLLGKGRVIIFVTDMELFGLKKKKSLVLFPLTEIFDDRD